MIEQLYGVAIVPLIIAIVSLLKDVVPEKLHKYMGLVAWALGLAIAFALWCLWKTGKYCNALL